MSAFKLDIEPRTASEKVPTLYLINFEAAFLQNPEFEVYANEPRIKRSKALFEKEIEAYYQRTQQNCAAFSGLQCTLKKYYSNLGENEVVYTSNDTLAAVKEEMRRIMDEQAALLQTTTDHMKYINQNIDNYQVPATPAKRTSSRGRRAGKK